MTTDLLPMKPPAPAAARASYADLVRRHERALAELAQVPRYDDTGRHKDCEHRDSLALRLRAILTGGGS